MEVGINRALESKYQTVDHLDGYLEGLVPASKEVDPTANGFFGYDFTNLADESLIEDLVDKTIENEVAIVTTQTLFTRWFSPTPVEKLATEGEMKYMSPKTLFTWRQSKTRMLSDPNFKTEQWERFIQIRKRILKRMDEKGVTFLLGSDAPQVFNVPGFSIHREMQDMADAGISNFEILQSGTINPAQFFGAAGEYGTIVEGAAADLILLDANPLEDISNAQKVAGVFVGKTWLSRAEIKKRLEAIALRYQE